VIVASFWNALTIVAGSFLLLIVLLALIAVFIDLARDPDLGTGVKVVWMIALIVFSVVSLIVYFLVRGKGMRARSGADDSSGSVTAEPQPSE
jgi:hypothetical protein